MTLKVADVGPAVAPSSLTYRPEIDGLRAIAVVSVILAHAGVPFLGGGFLGVDVFFVISGYLITRIISAETAAGGLSLRRFYERRARRILPALVLVLAACVPFAFWLMLPDPLQNFGQSLTATLLFANNGLLALTADYWDLASEQKPLLHTWSLGVEEQFYLVFPLFLVLAARFGRRGQVWGIALVGLASFLLSEAALHYLGAISFYLPTSRAWELMAGCLVAYVPRRATRRDGALSSASLLAVLLPMVLFAGIDSPSLWCLPSVLGTVGLLLYCREGSLAHGLLTVRPVVLIGLVSYSAYLWHQPLFAFARIASFTPPTPSQLTALTALTFVLAWLSWRWVEQPFRHAAKVPWRRFVALILVPAAGLVILGLVLHFQYGLAKRTFPNIAAAEDIDRSYNERVRRFAAERFPDNARANVLVVGNSYARDVANMLIESGALAGKNLVYQMAEGTCPVPAERLMQQADVVVIALSGEAQGCIGPTHTDLERRSPAPVVYFGTKYWGQNINPFVRVPVSERPRAMADATAEVAQPNSAVGAFLPRDRFVDLMRTLGPDGRHLRFFDDDGNPLTFDRLHFTRYGAKFVAHRLDAARSPVMEMIRNAVHRPRSGKSPRAAKAP